METLTKVYERHDVARQVVNELEAAGFPSSSISLVANKGISDRYDDGDDSSNAGAGAEAGLVVGGATGGLLAGLGALTIPGLGPVVAAGWLATTALGGICWWCNGRHPWRSNRCKCARRERACVFRSAPSWRYPCFSSRGGK
jgi:hypothetical protein